MKNYSFYSFIVFSFILLLVFVAVLPKYRELNDIRQKILVKEGELLSQENYLKEVQRISEELKKRKDSLEKIEAALPKSPRLSELLNFLQKAASQSGLVLDQIRTEVFPSSEMGKNIGVAQIGVALKGDYQGFKQFVSLVEKSDRLIEITNIDLTFSEKEKIFGFDLIIKVYFINENPIY